MIRSFANDSTEIFWLTGTSKRIPPANLRRVALRKLVMLDSATELKDLRVPPGNRLEELRGDRKGQYSIRINDQYRVCFRWSEGHAYDAEIVDYH